MKRVAESRENLRNAKTQYLRKHKELEKVSTKTKLYYCFIHLPASIAEIL